MKSKKQVTLVVIRNIASTTKEEEKYENGNLIYTAVHTAVTTNKPYIVSDGNIKTGDKFLTPVVTNEELSEKVFTFLRHKEIDLVEVKDEDGNEIISTKFLLEGARKVVASPDKIGLFKIGEDKEEKLMPIQLEHIQTILKSSGKCNLEWFDGKWFTDSEYSSEPLMHDNKVILSI